MCRSVGKLPPLCGVCLKLKHLYKLHTRIAHNPKYKLRHGNEIISKRTFTCGLCKQSFDRISQRNRHLRIHKTKEKRRITGIEHDKSRAPSDQEFIQTFTESGDLISSQNGAQDITENIATRFVSDSNTDVSLYCNVVVNENGLTYYKCVYCESFTDVKDDAPRHFETFHSSMYPCLICQKSFKDKHELENHTCNVSLDEFESSQISKLEVVPKNEKTVPLLGDSIEKTFTDTATQCEEFDFRPKRSVYKKIKEELFECKHCVYTTSRKESLRRHNKTKHANTRLFKCEMCSATFKTKKALEKHEMKVHYSAEEEEEEDEDYVPEDDGGDSANETTDLDVPKLNVVSEADVLKSGTKEKVRKKKDPDVQTIERALEKFGDSYCIEILDEENKLKRFQCTHCSYKTARRYDIKRHFMRHIQRGRNISETDADPSVKVEPTEGIGNFTSEIDIDKLGDVTKRKFWIEVFDEETQVKKYKCPICDYTTARKFDVKRHFLTRHESISGKAQVKGEGDANATDGNEDTIEFTKGGRKCLVCKVCGKKCKYAKHLLDHMNIHQGRRPYLCDICGIDFTHRAYLIKHRRLHTGEKFVECKICHKKFAAKHQLKQHENAHTGNRPYWCEYCGKGFMGTGNLRTHLRIHTGEKPYKCKLCDYRCIQANSLKKHMIASHGGTYDFPCQLCNSKFKFKSHLTAHMLRHKGELRHFCEFCGKGFVFSWGLIEHRRTHTNDRPYKCMICNQAFFRNSHLTCHIKNHHPGVEPPPLQRKSHALKPAQMDKEGKPPTFPPPQNTYAPFKIRPEQEEYKIRQEQEFKIRPEQEPNLTNLHTAEMPYMPFKFRPQPAMEGTAPSVPTVEDLYAPFRFRAQPGMEMNPTDLRTVPEYAPYKVYRQA